MKGLVTIGGLVCILALLSTFALLALKNCKTQPLERHCDFIEVRGDYKVCVEILPEGTNE